MEILFIAGGVATTSIGCFLGAKARSAFKRFKAGRKKARQIIVLANEDGLPDTVEFEEFYLDSRLPGPVVEHLHVSQTSDEMSARRKRNYARSLSWKLNKQFQHHRAKDAVGHLIETIGPYPTPSRDNELACTRQLRQHFESTEELRNYWGKMRPTHRAVQIKTIIAMYFTPTDADLELRQAMSHDMITNRQQRMIDPHALAIDENTGFLEFTVWKLRNSLRGKANN